MIQESRGSKTSIGLMAVAGLLMTVTGVGPAAGEPEPIPMAAVQPGSTLLLLGSVVTDEGGSVISGPDGLGELYGPNGTLLWSGPVDVFYDEAPVPHLPTSGGLSGGCTDSGLPPKGFYFDPDLGVAGGYELHRYLELDAAAWYGAYCVWGGGETGGAAGDWLLLETGTGVAHADPSITAHDRPWASGCGQSGYTIEFAVVPGGDTRYGWLSGQGTQGCNDGGTGGYVWAPASSQFPDTQVWGAWSMLSGGSADPQGTVVATAFGPWVLAPDAHAWDIWYRLRCPTYGVCLAPVA